MNFESMNFESILTCSVISLYFISTLGIFIGTLSMRRYIKNLAHWCTFAGFALQSILVAMVLLDHSLDELSAAYFMQLFAWSLILCYLLLRRFLRLPFLALTAAPIALVLCIFSVHLSTVTNVVPERLSALFMAVHILALFISLGFLALAFGAALLFLYSERRIKQKIPMAEFAKDFPALSTCDKLNRIAVMVGFPLYTLGLMSSLIWVPLSHATIGTPKVITSFITWFLFALLFYQRMALGHQGRRTAIMVIVIFSVAALSFIFDLSLTHHSKLLQP